jgi:hypothetical protein
MRLPTSRIVLKGLVLALGLIGVGCTEKRVQSPNSSLRPSQGSSPSPDPELAKRGSIEVTARLVEIPAGAIFEREQYNYATVLKYEVLEVHRGRVKGETIYVGHYNPFKPRSKAADRWVKDVGGNLKSFRAGQVHRMAMEESMLDLHMIGINNRYYGQNPDPIYWAVWTDLVSG